MKIRTYKKLYKELNKEFKELQKIQEKRNLTEYEEIRYDIILDHLDYIYRCNGYT